MFDDVVLCLYVYTVVSSIMFFARELDGYDVILPWEREEYKISNLIGDLFLCGGYITFTILGKLIMFLHKIILFFCRFNFTLWKRKN